MRHLLALTALLAGVPLAAQFVPDARTVPAGVLRVGFTPRYFSWNEVYDATGTVRPLGYRYATDSTARLFPTAGEAETAVRSLTGDEAWVLMAGRLDPRLDGDVRHFPFDFSLGITSWLTLRAVIPVVTTTMNAFPIVDTTGLNAGFATFDGPAADAAATTLLAAADQLAADAAAGMYGCPASTQCADALALESRVRAAATDLLLLGASPLQPLGSSVAGQGVAAALAQLDADLQALGLAATGLSVTLPAAALDSAGLGALVSEALGLSPLAPSKHTRRLGDIEVGARVALVTRPGFRLLADVMARLPTAGRGRALDPIDLPPGDRQLDLGAAVEAAMQASRASLWIRAGMEIQRPGTAEQLVTPIDRPLAPSTAVATVTRDPGDVLQVSVWPALRLTDDLRVVMTADWRRRGHDVVTLGGAPVPALEAETSVETLAFGGGLWYRSTRGRHVDALPIEAGLVYRTAFSGSGGLAPRYRQLDFGLRLYFGL